MKVSFDFDSTLDRNDVQQFAKELIAEGHEVWIVTSRISTKPAIAKGWHWVKRQNEDLYKVAEVVGIPESRIVFTEHIDKIVFLKDKGFAFHLDDDEWELTQIMASKDSCQPLHVDHFEWKDNCLKVLNKGKDEQSR